MPPPDPATAGFFAEIERRVRLPAGVGPADASLAVLCPLLLRVSLGTARRVVAALPPTLRSRLEGCTARYGGSPLLFDHAQFLRMIRYRLPDISTEEADEIIPAVLGALEPLLPAESQRQIASELPKDLKALWPAARRAA